MRPSSPSGASSVPMAHPWFTPSSNSARHTCSASDSSTRSCRAGGRALTRVFTASFAASSSLVTQINQGAPADLFASADTANMDKLTAATGAGVSAAPITFATNKLQIIVAKGNSKGITGVADLAKSGVIYVTAAPEVPIGAYAKQVLDKAKVTVTPKSLEADVKSVVNKVTLGEADAGIVYATDVKAAGDKAAGVVIP